MESPLIAAPAKLWPTCGRRLGLPLVTLSLFCLSGCVTLGSLLPGTETLPTGPVCQVVTAWHNQVAWTPDPARGGLPTPGLAGRVYLFGQEINCPLVGDGAVVVDLYDLSSVGMGGQPVVLEQWRFDPDTLKRLLRRDPVGWGYTLFLPWGTYRPDIARVQLRLRYEPPRGTPLYAEGSPLTLSQEQSATVPLAGRGNPAASIPAAALPTVGNQGTNRTILPVQGRGP